MGNVVLALLGAGAVVGGITRFIEARREGQIPWTVWGMLITGLLVLLMGIALLVQRLT